ncbi:MAG: glycoside hydrolase family 113 [Stellaceae bacterium]
MNSIGDAPRFLPAAGKFPRLGAFAVRGVSYPSYRRGLYASPGSAASIADLAKTGANYVAIVPTSYSRSIYDSSFYATGATESDAAVAEVIKLAHRDGLSVLLKPHVDPADGKPRAAYAPRDVDAWFRNYEAFLLRYARLASQNRVEMFGIGCELDTLVTGPYRDRWLRIIRAIRAVYPGLLIYASGGAVGGADVSFWDAVDLIGVDAYNPLSRAIHPSVAELVAGWRARPEGSWAAALTDGKPPLEYYRGLWEHYRKPVIFTEIGYKSVAGATARPGDWKYRARVDLDLQARAYQAFFEVWARESSWMEGAFLWNWEPVEHPERLPGGLAGYTPQNKPAGTVIRDWYSAMANAGRQRAELAPAMLR